MDASYKKKLKLIRDDQCGSPFYDRDRDKMIFQKVLILVVAILSAIYLSNFFN
jgi:hypothetical protein